MDSVWMCPGCGQPDALIALGARRDYPHRWRWWVSVRTQLYLCDQCDALVALGAAQVPMVESKPGQQQHRHPGTRTAASPYHRAHSETDAGSVTASWTRRPAGSARSSARSRGGSV